MCVPVSVEFNHPVVPGEGWAEMRARGTLINSDGNKAGGVKMWLIEGFLN